MSIWDTYPTTYRSAEVQSILAAVNTGECVSIVGLSGAGKSNLLNFLAHRVTEGPQFSFIDCNDLPSADSQALLEALIRTLDNLAVEPPSLPLLIRTVDQLLQNEKKKICIVLDRFDLFQLDSTSGRAITNNLRALRDHFKYSLTYVISTRRPLDPASELSELFYANTIWLGSLTYEDAQWSINEFARRHGLVWENETVKQIYVLSKGFPSILRAVCEAYTSGTGLTLKELCDSPAVQHRVNEFWSDHPSGVMISKSRLEDHPILMQNRGLILGNLELTASEQRLLDYFASHEKQLCTKEELIAAVWPEEKQLSGLRDDSLSQLVHRLREKLDPAGENKIHTLPGRGYRYQG